MDGIQVPAGERYDMVERANGELGFCIVSDGSSKPSDWVRESLVAAARQELGEVA